MTGIDDVAIVLDRFNQGLHGSSAGLWLCDTYLSKILDYSGRAKRKNRVFCTLTPPLSQGPLYLE
jgi:hypothetical protein